MEKQQRKKPTTESLVESEQNHLGLCTLTFEKRIVRPCMRSELAGASDNRGETSTTFRQRLIHDL